MLRHVLKTAARANSSLVTKPAPAFAAQALVKGQFQQVSLDDYKGKYLCLFFYWERERITCENALFRFSA